MGCAGQAVAAKCWITGMQRAAIDDSTHFFVYLVYGCHRDAVKHRLGSLLRDWARLSLVSYHIGHHEVLPTDILSWYYLTIVSIAGRVCIVAFIGALESGLLSVSSCVFVGCALSTLDSDRLLHHFIYVRLFPCSQHKTSIRTIRCNIV